MRIKKKQYFLVVATLLLFFFVGKNVLAVDYIQFWHSTGNGGQWNSSISPTYTFSQSFVATQTNLAKATVHLVQMGVNYTLELSTSLQGTPIASVNTTGSLGDGYLTFTFTSFPTLTIGNTYYLRLILPSNRQIYLLDTLTFNDTGLAYRDSTLLSGYDFDMYLYYDNDLIPKPIIPGKNDISKFYNNATSTNGSTTAIIQTEYSLPIVLYLFIFSLIFMIGFVFFLTGFYKK